MTSFKPPEVVKILERLGYIKKRQTGSHLMMYHAKHNRIIPVPIRRRP